MESKQQTSPIWSVLSIVCPVCYIVMSLFIKAQGHRGSGNLELFPPDLLLIVVASLGLGVGGIIFGLVGLTKGRWPLVALAGLILSGLLFIWPFIHF